MCYEIKGLYSHSIFTVIVNAYLESTDQCSTSLWDKKNILLSNFYFLKKVQINHPTQEICMNLEKEQSSPSGQLQKCTSPMPPLAVICCSWFTPPDYGLWSMLYVTTASESAHDFPVLTQLPSAAARYFRTHKGRLCELANQKFIYLKLFSWACRNQYLSRATLKITVRGYQRSLCNLSSVQVTGITTALTLHVQKGKERQKNCLMRNKLVYIFPNN